MSRTTHRHVEALGVVLLAAMMGAGDVHADPAPVGGDDRLVHHFDFDERAAGNLERIPKFWRRMNAPGFPRYAEGEFDFDAGHDAPPAFRLNTEGKNIAFRYAGHEIPANDANDYLVAGWIRTEGLERARASLSAYYLDYRGLPIASTQRFSELIGPATGPDAWQHVEIFLPRGPEDAKWIGITAWVVHPEVWDKSPRPRRSIERKEIGAAAAVDDIRVYRLPRVTLETSSPANVFAPDSTASLSVEVTDVDTVDLTAALDIVNVDDDSVFSTSVPVRNRFASSPTVVDLRGMPNGLFTARVRVETSNGILAERSLRFASLQTSFAQRSSAGERGFGIALDVTDRTDPRVELALLRTLNAGTVKIPIWSGSAHVPDFLDADRATDALLDQLPESRVNVIGVFAGPPSSLVRDAGAYPRPLIAMLNSDADVWREHLVRVFAPYASIFRSWQIGLDADQAVISDPNLPSAVRRVRTEIEKLITAPHLTVPASFFIEPGDPRPPADTLSFDIDAAVTPSAIRSHVDGFRARGLTVKTAYVEMPDRRGIERRSHLRDWCKRLILARHAGIDSVIVPQLWHSRSVAGGTVTEPDEEFVLLHTLTQLIGDARPASPIYVAPGVTALAFNGPSGTVVAMWDEQADADTPNAEHVRRHAIQLGAATRQIDMWGRVTTLTTLDDGRKRVRLGTDPVFIDGVDRWLVDFRTQLTLTPDFLELSVDAHRHQWVIANPHDQPLRVHMRVTPPDGWEINPRRFAFALSPGQQVVKPFDIRFRRDMIAGTKVIHVAFDLDAGQPYRLQVPVQIEAGVRDLEAWGQAVISGDRLIVRHRVFNRSDQTLNLRAFAVAPGRARQTRFLTEFLPGQTTTLEYHFKDFEPLIGRSIRLHLREITGPRVHNIEVQVR